jgi:hypothetical protein
MRYKTSKTEREKKKKKQIHRSTRNQKAGNQKVIINPGTESKEM